MDRKLQTLIIAIIVIILLVWFTSKHADEPEVENGYTPAAILNLKSKVDLILEACGYDIKYELHSHPNKTFTLNKKKIYICTSCASDDRLLYIGLHEAAHLLTSNPETHGVEWETTFKTLLKKGQELGLLLG